MIIKTSESNNFISNRGKRGIGRIAERPRESEGEGVRVGGKCGWRQLTN
jgi:hypothetical protein